MQKFVFPFLISTVLFAGCAKHDDGAKTAATPDIPGTLEWSAKPGSDLTAEQRKAIRATFAKHSLVSDAVDFAYKRKEESSKDEEKRKDRYAKSSPEVKKWTESLRGKCDIQDPEKKSNDMGTVPTVGTKVITQTTSSIRGERCPVDSSNIQSTQVLYEAIDLKDRSYVLRISGESRQLIVVKDPSLQKQSGAVSSLIGISYKGIARSAGDKTNTYVEGTGPVELETLSGKISGTIKMKILNKEGVETTLMDLSMDHLGTPVAVGVVERKEGSRKSAEYYLNGRKTNLDDLKDLFGEGFNLGSGL